MAGEQVRRANINFFAKQGEIALAGGGGSKFEDSKLLRASEIGCPAVPGLER